MLTTDCPDTTGVVAAIAGFLARNNALITEAQHFDDEISVRSFMRTVFHDNGKGMPPIAELERDFAESVAAPFDMTWKFATCASAAAWSWACRKPGTASTACCIAGRRARCRSISQR